MNRKFSSLSYCEFALPIMSPREKIEKNNILFASNGNWDIIIADRMCQVSIKECISHVDACIL